MHAGFWKRFFAYILDVIVLYVLTILLGFLSVFLDIFIQHLLLSSPTKFGLLWYQGYFILRTIFLISVVWLYYAFMESSKLQGTLGKKALGIIVVDEHFGRISFGRAAGRFWSKFISVLTLYVGFIMAAFTKNKQALHDIIAKTYVVDKRVLDMSKAQYQQYPPYPEHPQYPEYPPQPQ